VQEEGGWFRVVMVMMVVVEVEMEERGLVCNGTVAGRYVVR
jgi:hypothetical protein